MNLRNKLTRIETQLTAHHANPFVEGTHAHFVRLSWGADSDATPTQWIQNTTTGERYEVTPEWQRLLNAYHDQHVQTIRPRFVWSLAPTPNQEPTQ